MGYVEDIEHQNIKSHSLCAVDLLLGYEALYMSYGLRDRTLVGTYILGFLGRVHLNFSELC